MIASITYAEDELLSKSIEPLVRLLNRKPTSKGVKVLNLLSLKTNDSCMRALFSNLANDPVLRKLRISDINLSNSKVFQSVKSAVAASNVQLLDLSACSFTNRQIEDLGEILAENCAIESLNLKGMLIG